MDNRYVLFPTLNYISSFGNIHNMGNISIIAVGYWRDIWRVCRFIQKENIIKGYKNMRNTCTTLNRNTDQTPDLYLAAVEQVAIPSSSG